MKNSLAAAVSVCNSFLFALLCTMTLGICQAQASGEITELLLGIEPEHNIFDQMGRYRALAEYVSERTNVKVKLTIMSRYGEVLNRFKSRRLDGAFLNSFTATLAINEFELEPVARPVNLKGVSITQGYIFARKDSGIKTVRDMKGRSFVFVDPATTEGYVFPLAFLQRHGIKDKEAYFRRYYFSGSHFSTIFAVLDGRADIGSVKDTVFHKQVSNDPSIKTELNIIEESPYLPETTLCIRHDLPTTLKQKLTDTLLRMNKTESGKKVLEKMEALRFIRAKRSDFDIILSMARDAGISMKDHRPIE